ncbi:MAG: SUMF1/EgtB/PvdO family nonheme iron enzyme [Candidatus Pacearchaeota archaeon]
MLYFKGGEVELFRNPLGETFIESVDPFWISESEITIGQWLAYLERDRGYDPKEDTYNRKGGVPENIRNPNMPVKRISFLNALRFVEYLSARTGKNYRIPTAGEWLLAWRGENIPKEGIYGETNREIANIFWVDKDLERRVKEMENSRGALNLREWAELREILERNQPKLCQ